MSLLLRRTRFASHERLALLLAFSSGYISLSQEIIWIRAISFYSGGKPAVFSYVLATFLLGIAIGSLIARRIVSDSFQRNLTLISYSFITSAATFFFLFSLGTYGSTIHELLGLAIFFFAIMLCATILGCVLPLSAQLIKSSTDSPGRIVSKIYLSNILGSSLGPLITGFLFLDKLSLVTTIEIVAILSVVTGLVGALLLPHKTWHAPRYISFVLIFVFIISQPFLYSDTLEKLFYKTKSEVISSFKHIRENKSGIITVSQNPQGDIISGGGIYDGRLNIDPLNNANNIFRAYVATGLHRRPNSVLVIGLGGGSWAAVMLTDPRVKKLIAVDINPGYGELISHYPGINWILKDRRASFVFDDGRRWLNRNPDKRFDMIVMNTTFHWRANTTNLLSKEFLEIAKEHLEPGGILYYNTTKSEDAIKTASTVFQHVTKVSSFIAASNLPFDFRYDERLSVLRSLKRPQGMIFPSDSSAHQNLAKQIAQHPFNNLSAIYRNNQELKVITDDNVLTEYQNNSRLYRTIEVVPEYSWQSLASRVFDSK